MIIEAPYKVGDVISLKLTSGEEVIARLEEETDKGYKVTKPLMLAATQQGLGLAPYMFSVSPETKVTMNKSAVISVSKTIKEMSDQYIQGTTGIHLA